MMEPVNEFINGYRLRHARLHCSPTIPTNIEVEYRSRIQFTNPHLTVVRTFGMSPSEYKAVSKKKKKT